MTNEKDILKDILIDEEDVISNLSTIVKKAKEIFAIESKTGKIIFKNYSKLKNTQKICAILIGKYFSKRLNLIEDTSIKISDLSKELGIPSTTLSAPLKSLKDKGIIFKDKENYRINPHRIEEIIDNFFKTDMQN